MTRSSNSLKAAIAGLSFRAAVGAITVGLALSGCALSALQPGTTLNEALFARIAPGMSSEEVRRQLGTPTRVWGVRLRNQTVWSYSFDDLFCRQFHVGLTPAGVVDDTSYGPDPRCDERRFLD